MEEKISVIIPVYNVEAYLVRCMESVIGNTYAHLEIICVDDGSTDGCGAILEAYARRDPRITVITQENGGLSAARNRGMEQATGDFIAFIDSDDWVHPQYFAALMHQQKKQNADIVICDHERVEQEKPFAPVDVEQVTGTMVSLTEVSGVKHLRTYAWGRLYRRELLQKLRFRKGLVPEDSIFNGEVFCSREMLRIVHVHAPLYFYFNRPGSLVTQITGAGQKRLLELFFELAKRTKGKERRAFALEQGIRCGLSAWYTLWASGETRAKRETGALLRRCGRRLAVLGQGSLQKRLGFLLMCYIPLIYRRFRIRDDSTMLDWERRMKEKRSRKRL